MSSLYGRQQPQQPDPETGQSMVSVEGSDTMGDLLEIWAEAFMKSNPDVPVSPLIRATATQAHYCFDFSHYRPCFRVARPD